MDAANAGPIRPPLVYLLAIVLGTVIHFVVPFPFLPGGLALPLGGSLMVVAALIFASSVGTFRSAGTPVPGHEPTVAIVRKGPYRFSRNPIYLAFSLLQLGIAVALNSVWLLATLAGAMALMQWVVIAREEAYLERKFGEQYLAYKASVRRWL